MVNDAIGDQTLVSFSHTDGPWRMGDDCVLTQDGRLVIAQVWLSGGPLLREQAVANGRLIAAAPELLDLLAVACTMIDLEARSHSSGLDVPQEARKSVYETLTAFSAKARSAIANATIN